MVQVPDGSDTVPITGMKYNPQTPGEKLITLKVAPQEGELFVTNNEISTFVTVLSGGLNVLFLQGPTATWDYRYVYRADRDVARHPGRGGGDSPARRRETRESSTTPSSPPASTTSTSCRTCRPRRSRDGSSTCWPRPPRKGRA